MKTKDFDTFKVKLNLSIELDGVIRSISEKIKLIHQRQDNESLRYVIDFLRATDVDIDNLIKEQICKDETEN